MTVGQQKIPVVHPQTFKDSFIIVQYANGKRLIKREDIARYEFLGLSRKDLERFKRYYGNGKMAPVGVRGKMLYYDLDELLSDGNSSHAIESVQQAVPNAAFNIVKNGKMRRL